MAVRAASLPLLLFSMLAFVGRVCAFEYFLFKMDWNPTSCVELGSGCVVQPFQAFTLDRLKPYNYVNKLKDQVCAYETDVSTSLSPATVAALNCIDVNLGAGGNPQLWTDIWNEAGSCIGTFTISEYFDLLITLYAKYNANEVMYENSLAPPSVDRDVLLNALSSSFGAQVWQDCNYATGSKNLQNVVVCLHPYAPYDIVDCPFDRYGSGATTSGLNCAGQLPLASGIPVSSGCAQYIPYTYAGPTTPPPPPPLPSSPTPTPATSPPPPAGSSPAPYPVTPLNSPPAPIDGGGGGGTSMGAIIGGVVAGLAVVAAVVAGIVLVRRRKQRQSVSAASALPTTAIPAMNGDGPYLGGADVRMASSPPAEPVPGGYGYYKMPAVAATGAAGAASYASQDLKLQSYRVDVAGSLGSTQPPTPSSPPLPPSPSASAFSARRSGASALANDPLMQYINSTLVPSGITRAGSDLASWELNFCELQIEQPVGEGSWGRVYKAKWHETAVAVKVLLEGGAPPGGGSSAANTSIVSASDPVLARLKQEAGLISSMRHPNIVQFLGMTIVPATLVSEYCSRGSLLDVLRAGKASAAKAQELGWPRRVGMAADACLGMCYLHSRSPPIVHRDLKSPNLLVDASWKVKVADFGLSKIMEDSSKSTSMAAMNPRWLAPEVLSGESATPAADVFAFGVVLWELMTWDLPWGAANPWVIVGAINQGGRPQLPPLEELPGGDSTHWAGLPRYMELMKRCWAQNPLDRPTFQEVVAELRAIEPSLQA